MSSLERDCPTWKHVIRSALTARIAASAAKTAFAVGVVLNLLNHGSALLEGQPISVVQLAMNFVVPFCVSGYSASRAELSRTDRKDS